MAFSYKETYMENLAYAKKKSELSWWITILYGVLGGAFIALGYFGAITIKGALVNNAEKVVATFLAGMIFPTGIIFCIFMGGGLLTSDSLSTMTFFEKVGKPRNVLINIPMTLLGNLIGGMIIAAIATGARFFNNNAGTLHVLEHLVSYKQNLVWYGSFFSGIICNLLVAGAIWISHASRTSSGKIILIWFPIALFAMSGFEHIVANFFIFWSGIFNNNREITDATGAVTGTLHIEVGKFIYSNLIPTLIGNFIAGGILIPLPYHILKKYYYNKISSQE